MKSKKQKKVQRKFMLLVVGVAGHLKNKKVKHDPSSSTDIEKIVPRTSIDFKRNLGTPSDPCTHRLTGRSSLVVPGAREDDGLSLLYKQRVGSTSM